LPETSKTVLHVGCGRQAHGNLHPAFLGEGWRELRLDIDPDVEPDIVGSITDMADVRDGSMAALYSSHNVEHLFAHEVPLALREFRRVLRPDGFALITLPDIQSVCEAVLERGLETPAYVSPIGPIAPLDIMYGFRPALAQGKIFMAHRCAFTAQSLLAALTAAGFGFTVVQRCLPNLSLWAVAWVAPPDALEQQRIQDATLPLNRAARSRHPELV
jgi:SAM-dependent methyltransferase